MRSSLPQRVRLTANAEYLPIKLQCIYNARALGVASRYPFICSVDHMGRPTNKIYVDIAELVQWGLARGDVINLPKFIEVREGSSTEQGAT